jgi:serine phosphatase RsbU (regulator of sigma subunit)
MKSYPDSPVTTPASSPIEALQRGVRQRQSSLEGLRAWRLLRVAALATLVAALLGHIPLVWLRHFVVLLSGGVAVLAASALLLDRGRGSRWWRWALLIGLLLLIPAGSSAWGRVLASITVALFLLLRRYRVMGELRSRQRAATFGISLLSIILLAAAPGSEPGGSWLGGLLGHAAGLLRYGLVFFWSSMAIRLFLGVRLHFLRLRPKLAVTGMLIALVPLILVTVLAFLVGWGMLGAARSTQGRDLLIQWGRSANGDLVALLETPLGAETGGARQRPDWWPRLQTALESAGISDPDSTVLLHTGTRLWAVQPPGATEAEPRGRALEPAVMQRLAELLRCELTLRGGGRGVEVDEEDDAGDRIRIQVGDQETEVGNVLLSARPVAEADSTGGTGWLDRWLHFGGATLSAQRLDEDDRLSKVDLLLSLKARPRDVVSGFVSGDNQINRAVAVGMAVLAGIFLLLEGIALYFGLRIVGGITSAVHRLHGATERLARGDLDTWIALPNEDEFGDLAASFNEMTSAVRVGQQQALQRERLEQELLMARTIQERLLPSSMPEVRGFEIAASSVPSRQVGGDYFDFLWLDEERLGLAVGDVSGKGIPAALLMSNLQACLQGQVIHRGSVAETVTRMNSLLAASTDTHMFATFFYGVLDAARGELISTNAGHDPPVLVRADGTLERLRSGGLILGMLPGQSYVEERSRIEMGDVLVCYTDGITEAMGPPLLPPELPAAQRSDEGAEGDEEEDDEDRENFFEEERLLEVLRRHRHESADRIRDAVLGAVQEFTGGTPQSDDLTLVVVKRVGPSGLPGPTPGSGAGE